MTLQLDDLLTPSLVLDRRKLRRNIERMSSRVTQLGVTLRPHVKTPKSIDVLREIPPDERTAITVSTLREASYFLSEGVTDMFYAVPLAPSKVPAVADLLRRGADLKILVDGMAGARACAAGAKQTGARLPVLVELDVDNYRSGIELDDPQFVDLCSFLSRGPHTELRGIMTYGGASYQCSSIHEMADLAERHRRTACAAVAKLEGEGIACPIVSFGSTPATMFARTLKGFTEVRRGIFLFQDLYQAGIKACTTDDIALTALTTIISQQPRLNRFTIDAGGLALSKDVSTRGKPFDAGYGLICDLDCKIIPDLFVIAVSQELGLVTTRSGAAIDFDSFTLGRKLRILPNHADMTAAAHDVYHVTDGGREVVAVWNRVNGW